MDKDEVPEAKLWDAAGHHNSSTKRPSGAHLAANFELWLSTGSAATYFRCGRTSCMRFIYNSLLFSTVKEFWKSIRFWQSYHHQLGGPLFGTQCRWNSTGYRRRLCLRPVMLTRTRLTRTRTRPTRTRTRTRTRHARTRTRTRTWPTVTYNELQGLTDNFYTYLIHLDVRCQKQSHS